MIVDRTPKPCNHPMVKHIHGTYRAYLADKCRCWPCHASYCAYSRAKYRIWRETGPLLVDIARVRAHVEKLRALGWSHATICRIADVPNGVVQAISYGDRKAVVRATEKKLMALPLMPPTHEQQPLFGDVPSVGARRRVEALVCLGWSLNKIAQHAGLCKRTLSEMSRRRDSCTAATYKAIVATYEALWNTQPPMETKSDRIAAVKARNWAERNRWAPPMAWDDDQIDNPDAVPSYDGGDDKTRRELYATGASDLDIGNAVGVSRDAIRAWRNRHGLASNYAPRGRTA